MSSKITNVQLTKESDGVKAVIDVIENSAQATINFSPAPFFPFILDENNLKDIKKEIDIVLKKINDIKKELNPSPIKKTVRKVITKKSK